MVTIPPDIDATGFRGAPIKFKQDPDALRAATMKPAPKIAGWIRASTNQAGLAFSAALVEWVAWRMDGIWQVQILLDFAESLWAAQADPAYAKKIPVPEAGPDLSSHYIRSVWASANAQRQFVADGLSKHALCVELAQVALLVAPSKKPLNEWVKAALERLYALYPVEKDLREDRSDCNGPPVPREALDLSTTFDPDTTDDALRTFLAALEPTKNPFLATSQEMSDAGFSGTPYEY